MKVAKQKDEWRDLSTNSMHRINKLQGILNVCAEVYSHTRNPRVAGRMKELENEIEELKDREKELEKYYVRLDFPVTAKRLHQHGYDDWKRVPYLKNFTKDDREQYEAFVMGYLFSFEKYGLTKEEKEKNKQYTIFFDWGETRPGEFDLIIYLNPLEERIYKDYDLKEDKVFEAEESGSTYAEQISHLPPPPSMVDPVPPPGPPPPPKPGKNIISI
ncbi:MAG: hypothetical protein WDO19_16425 [Bacteroidota bacterium]